MGAFERCEIFLRAADVMAGRGEEAIAALAQGDRGVPGVRGIQPGVLHQVREAAAAIARPAGELLPTSIPGAYSMAQRIPLGVGDALTSEGRSGTRTPTASATALPMAPATGPWASWR
jgi:acyl-CoA reductase-like NAD-dependent aldehyde dehydrogenase